MTLQCSNIQGEGPLCSVINLNKAYMDFEKWYTEMKSNFFWWQRTNEMYGKKDLNKVASEVHLYLIADGSLEKEDWQGWRKLFQAFARRADDVTGIQLQQIEVPKKQEEWIPLTGEERQKRLQEFLDKVQEAPIVKRIAPLSHKEILENGDWKPKPESVKEPSEVEKLAALNAHIEKINRARTELYLSAYPDATKEEIEAYLNSFEII